MKPCSWDLFCRVVDHYGDAGVAWRLARRLADGRAAGAVRLWVDRPEVLHALCPALDVTHGRQRVDGVEVRRWDEGTAFDEAPARVAVEAFGCGLPERYVEALARRRPAPLWIVLEYLSAEPWVASHHGLPSPHPRWPIERYFFFPGFDSASGGLLRERDYEARRAAFEAGGGRERFWDELGHAAPGAAATTVSLFAYRAAPVAPLLAAWAAGDAPVVAAVPEGVLVEPVLDCLGAAGGTAARVRRRGSLEVRLLPFLPQPRYDALLWACDCNFVRGEDSFVRAQWAARPCVWQAYPQPHAAHEAKLEAFLDRYCAGLTAAAAAAVRGLWRAWNDAAAAPPLAEAWKTFWNSRLALQSHARAWPARLAEAGELADKLAQFCAQRLK